MDESANGEAGNVIFVTLINPLAKTKHGRQFLPGQSSPVAGLPEADADLPFKFGAENNLTVEWFAIDRFANQRIVYLLQTEIQNPLLERRPCHSSCRL
ncbi:hypothetical protein ILFOPFJJ_06099 [Ensifer psoraleae]|nr:hypothetical protein [Sinorhizobium psoraleae]